MKHLAWKHGCHAQVQQWMGWDGNIQVQSNIEWFGNSRLGQCLHTALVLTAVVPQLCL